MWLFQSLTREEIYEQDVKSKGISPPCYANGNQKVLLRITGAFKAEAHALLYHVLAMQHKKKNKVSSFSVLLYRPNTKLGCFKFAVWHLGTHPTVSGAAHNLCHFQCIVLTQYFSVTQLYYSLVPIHPASLFQHPMLQAILSDRNVFRSLLKRKLCKRSTNFIVMKKKKLQILVDLIMESFLWAESASGRRRQTQQFTVCAWQRLLL